MNVEFISEVAVMSVSTLGGGRRQSSVLMLCPVEGRAALVLVTVVVHAGMSPGPAVPVMVVVVIFCFHDVAIFTV